MASSRDRQRQLAREKLERQTVRRAERVRRRRQVNAGVAAGVALLVIIGGALWYGGVFDPKPAKPAAAGDCSWLPNNSGNSVIDTGNPPASGMAKTGVAPMEITTNLGVIKSELDLAKAPCAGASFAHLAGKQFFNNTKCHRLSTSELFLLQCGSKNGDGSGEPSYQYSSEFVPQAGAPSPSATGEPQAPSGKASYPAGTIALMNAGAGTNGSQFVIFYKDTLASAAYGIVGKVTSGLDLISKAAEAGAVNPEGKAIGDGRPKTEVTIQSLTVAKPTQSAT
ncbi:peptidylprolyl isomerase [Longispora albida]|uniref:peptidylprolyl isomerase n=1 Tax=Longispora albida TaxID=203523 RepID=UPI0003710F14|nr:peptidylprolyl isomerase [Longispora albida]